jgi:hypothetical protein
VRTCAAAPNAASTMAEGRADDGYDGYDGDALAAALGAVLWTALGAALCTVDGTDEGPGVVVVRPPVPLRRNSQTSSTMTMMAMTSATMFVVFWRR